MGSKTQGGPLSDREIARRRKLLVTLACFLILLAVVVRSLRRPPRFPVPRGEARSVVNLAPPRLPPPPARPTLPGLAIGVPVTIPGLEALAGAYSPCLAPDLKTIIFAAPAGKDRYDLLTARRDDINDSFDPPRPLASCNTSAIEAEPTLSPDGLELIFMRSEAPGEPAGRLYYATRPSNGSPFRTPVPVPIANLVSKDVYQQVPQFAGDGLGVAFKVVTLGKKEQHNDLFAERSYRMIAFEEPSSFPVRNPWAINILSPDGLRTYVTTPEGFQISSRRTTGEPFGPIGGVPALRSETLGPIDGPSWVSPQEDVMFYCSPGPGKPPGGGRFLWMVRFR